MNSDPCVFLFFFCCSNSNLLCVVVCADKQEEGLLGLGNLKSFSFKELHVATDGFSSKHILGAGGFGNVYRGKLGDGTMVAVKRLKDVNGASGNSQFRTELEMISLAVHRNLLRLIGYCVSSSERLLVYPYMSNGSVASRLKGNTHRTHLSNRRLNHFLTDDCLLLQLSLRWIGTQGRR